jgi:LysR family transcriptional activator of nhaA
MLGRKLLNWFNSQGLKVEILGEFDDAALMKAFGARIMRSLSRRRSTRMISIMMNDYGDWRMDNVMEEYHAILPKE